MNGKPTVEGIHPDILTKEYRQQVMEAVNLIK